MTSAYTALAMGTPPARTDKWSSPSTDGGSETFDGGAYIHDHEKMHKRRSSSSAMASSRRQIRWIVFGAAFLFLFAFLYLFSPSASSTARSRAPTPPVVDVSTLNLPLRHDLLYPDKTFAPSEKLGFTPALNSTLGFERIYVLNMPARRDKKAEITVLGMEYGLNLTFVDAVNGKAARPDLQTDRHRQGLYGVAEGHAAVWRRMLSEGVNTALIMEDDVDFHVMMKDQLLRIQEPLAMLTSLIDGKPSFRNPEDPYNSAHWDQLWLGEETEHAWTFDILSEANKELPYVVFRDPTRSSLLPDVEHEHQYVEILDNYKLERHFDDKDADQRLRVLQTSLEPFALSGYALTQRGAKLALYKNAHKSWIDHIDFDMKEMSREGFARHYTLVPPIFQQRKPLQGEDSDRSGISDSHVIAGKEGRTSTIWNTAREHLAERLLSYKKPAVF